MIVGETKRGGKRRAGIAQTATLGLIAIIALHVNGAACAAPVSEIAGPEQAGLRAERSRRERLVKRRDAAKSAVTTPPVVEAARPRRKSQAARDVTDAKPERNAKIRPAASKTRKVARKSEAGAKTAARQTDESKNAPAPSGAASAVNFSRRTVGGVFVQVVSVDLTRPGIRVTPVLARRGPGSDETLSQMMRREAPTAAITGTFFDPRSRLPVGDIVIGGELVHFGGRGAGLCISAARQSGGVHASMRDNAGRDRHSNWRQSEAVMAGGMWLVRNGAVAPARVSRAAPARVLRYQSAPPPRWEGPVVASRGGTTRPKSRETKAATGRAIRPARRNVDREITASAKRTRPARISSARRASVAATSNKRPAVRKRRAAAPVVVAANGAHMGRD